MDDDDDDNCIVTSMFGGDDVLLNGWMFCCAHSREHCHKCCRDHRMANNAQFEDELTEQQYELLTDYGTEDLTDRKPICARALWQKLPGGRIGCFYHGKVGCSECFDFKDQVLMHNGLHWMPPAPPAAESPAAVAGSSSGTTAAQSPAPNAADSSTEPSVQPTAATAAAGTSTSNEPEHSVAAKKCWGCGVASSPSVKLQKCAACKRARYCSRGCQHQHYPEHKLQCKQWRAE